jgi:hypothetical protein
MDREPLSSANILLDVVLADFLGTADVLVITIGVDTSEVAPVMLYDSIVSALAGHTTPDELAIVHGSVQ